MLYQRIENNYKDFTSHKFIASYEFDSDWCARENHPHGDKIVLLLSAKC
jgi:hypothetical protein